MNLLRQSGLAVVFLLLAHNASAHDLERTQVRLRFERDGSFLLDVSHDPNWLLLRLERFADTPLNANLDRDQKLRELAPVFIDRVVLFVDSREVRPMSAEYLPATGTYRLRGRMASDAQVLRWYYGLVVDPYPLSVERADGRILTEWVAGDAWSRSLDLSGQFAPPSRWRVALQYLSLGYTHILPKGLDHILFVVGLFLLTIQLRPILIQVTAFTIAHSITLGLTMYDVVSLPSQIVEPLIALSIAYVAIENLVTTELKPIRLLLVFSFGLLHGMGFAGVLKELGLPRSEFLTALLSFNVGVEAGQLTVIAMAGLCVIWFRHREWYHRRVVMPGSMLIAAIGVYWTISRI